jgi:hypothetical protein
VITDLYNPGLACQRVTIGSLPDDILLKIFHFCRISTIQSVSLDRWYMNWHELAHICQRWRSVVFGSPLGLDLQILCTPKVPARRLLNVWPAFPLRIYFYPTYPQEPEENLDNLIAALEHPDRVSEVNITSPSDSLWDQVLAVMQEPFPALTHLSFVVSIDRGLHLPGTFLNVTAPCLNYLHFSGVSFPSFPRLLLSATDLTILHLHLTPNIWYIPPEAMATCLSTLTKLETLTIRFQSPTPHPKRRNRPLPPQTRSVLPALTRFDFRGVSEYLEVLAGRIDAPRLEFFEISFFSQLVIDIPQTIRFLSHLEWVRKSRPSLEFNPTGHVDIFFYPDWSHVNPISRWGIKCQGLDWQVFSAAQICSQIVHLSSGVEELRVNLNLRYKWKKEDPPRIRPDDIDPTLWLDLFQSFPSVRRLTISAEMEPFFAAALQRPIASGNSAPDVLPSLVDLNIDGLIQDKATNEGIESFITARKHSGYPVTVDRTQSETWI